MRNKYIIFGMILIVCSSLFLIGCNKEENKEISYEIISFEDAPKEVQDEIRDVDKRIQESASINKDSRIHSSGSIDLGKERYEFVMTNNEVPEILEVEPNEAFGVGIQIVSTTQQKENVVFPATVTIVKLKEYYGKVVHTSVSHP